MNKQEKQKAELNYHSIRTYLLMYITAGLALILAVYTTLNIMNAHKQNKANETKQLKEIHKELQNEITLLTRQAMAFTKIFSDRDIIKHFIANKDHQAIRQIIDPTFQILHNKFGVSHFYIHSIDEYVLFRGHNPDEYGDVSSFYRPMLIDAKNKKTTTGGIECDVDRLGIRGVSPIIDNDKIIGLIEIGLNYDVEYLQELKKRTGIDYRIWVSYKATASSGFWSDKNAPPSPTDSVFYYASTALNLPVLNGALYDKVLQTNNSIVEFIESHGKSIAVLLTPLYGYNNQQIGIIELHKDRTERIVDIKYDQMCVLFLAALLAITILGLMWIVISRVILKPLAYLVKIAQRQQQGELEVRSNLKHTDEFGLLGETLDTLSDKLKITMAQQDTTIETLHKTEKSLREKEENLRITLNSIGDAVISTDINGRVVRMNPIAEQLTGYSIDESKGHYILEIFNIINAETRKKAENPIEKILDTGYAVELANHTVLIAKDGTERQIADAGTPIYNDEGNLVGTVLVFRDVTDQYLLTERLHQSEKMQAIGQLAGGIAHDFNNMLGGIIGSAELLDMNLEKEQTKCHKSVELIIKMAQRASNLTDKLLAFSRKGKRIEMPVDLHAIVNDTVAILERSIDKRINIKLKLEATSSIVLGDPSQLQNALLNLGVNARDAMNESGTFAISTKNLLLDDEYCNVKTSELKSGHYIQITVSDTGHGIPHELQKKIFEPFFTTKKTGQGTGLGLSAVYGTVRDHQGDITIYSELDKGTVFHLYLPVIEETIQVEEQPNKKQITGNGVILVVDDEEVIRITASNILENFGYEVLTAEDGKQGLKVYIENKNRIDLVILDMTMPVMNGEEAFNAILHINPEAKIIITSGFSHEIKIQHLQANNDNFAFIKKPYHISELNELIETMLSKN